MRIRTRLALWTSAILVLSLLLMLGVLYYELVVERRAGGRQEETPEKITDILLFYGLPSAVVLVAGAWWFMSRALDPVARLTRTVERIQADNLDVRIPRSGNGDELDRLSAVFDAMMNRLQDAFGRIREFTLHASHELKTPLTIMRGEVETLLRTGTWKADQREVLEGHLAEIDRLSRIVDNLGLLARADAGLMPLDVEEVLLDDLMREACEDACVLAEAQGLSVEMGTSETLRVRGDRHRLRQVLLNLVDNAVKYNFAGGRVTLEVRRVGEWAEARIGNTGPGIPPEQLHRIFDRFYRGQPAQRGRIEGSGLGLSIAKSLIQAHGGTIDAEVAGEGWTVLRLRLPLATGNQSSSRGKDSML